VAFSGGVRSEAGPVRLRGRGAPLGGGMSYGATRYDLPGVIAAGMSYEDPDRGLRVAADLESPTHYYRSLRVGGEWLWRGTVRAARRLPERDRQHGCGSALGPDVRHGHGCGLGVDGLRVHARW
jgi:hypothetical protein